MVKEDLAIQKPQPRDKEITDIRLYNNRPLWTSDGESSMASTQQKLIKDFD